MERFLVHRTIFDRVQCSILSASVGLQAAFDQIHDGRLATADRSHHQHDTFAYFQALRSGVKVLDDLLQGLFDAEDFLAEEVVAWFTGARWLDTRIHNHMINPLMGKASYFWLFGCNLKVLRKSSLPL